MSTCLKKIFKSIILNRITLAGMVIGTVLGYLYWWNFGIYWGSYPLSSEWWVICIYGCLLGGLVGSLNLKNYT